jgi:tetratricopeptide (TPR) repeat protein
MAPEQASFNALDIDTRADIYALGVILYELLTGSTPIQRETFKQAALDEILRVIREVEPPTPSSRISTSEALPTIAATRQFEPTRLGRFVRGELDWIVMKALAKERQRRYESAIALAQDVERFTNHEPVSAGPPTASYRLRKFVRRNRPQVLAAALVLLALLAGIVGTTLGLVEARRQERLAVAESREKEKARVAEALQRRTAEEQRRQAEKRLTQIERANEILGSIFKDLDPRNEEKEGKPLRAVLGERLEQATAQIEGEAIGDPLTVARMQMTLGSSLLGLGYPEKAVALFTKARATFTVRLGSDHRDTVNCMKNLAVAYQDAGQYDRALPLFDQTLALAKAKLGPSDRETLHIMYKVATFYGGKLGKVDRALALHEERWELSKARLGPDHPDTLNAMHNLAVSYRMNRKVDRALALFEELLPLEKARLGLDDPLTLHTMADLARMYGLVGKHDQALALYEEELALSRSKLGPDHPSTLTALNFLAYGYSSAGQPEKALPLYEEFLRLTQVRFGSDHPDTFTSMNDLANACWAAGQRNRALALYAQTLELRKAKLGPDHPDTLSSMISLAHVYRLADQPDRALSLHVEALALRKAKLGPDHPDTLTSMTNLAAGYQDAGQLDRALPLWHELADRWKRKAGADSTQYAGALGLLGENLLRQEKWAEAENVLREVLTIRETKQPNDWRTFNAQSKLGGALLGQKQYAAAEPLLRAGYEGLKLRAAKVPPQARPRIGEALDRLIALAEATNKPDEARMWKDEKAKLPAASAPKPGAENP